MFLNSVSQMKFGVLESEFAELGFQAVLESEAVVKNFMAEGVIDGIVNIVVGFFKMIASAIEAVIRFILNLFGLNKKKPNLDEDLKKARAGFKEAFSGTGGFDWEAHREYMRKQREQTRKEEEEREQKWKDFYERNKQQREQQRKRQEESNERSRKAQEEFERKWNEWYGKGSSSSSSSSRSGGSSRNYHSEQVLKDPASMTIQALCNVDSSNPVFTAANNLLTKFKQADFAQSLSTDSSNSLINGVTKIKDIAEQSSTHTSFLVNLQQAYQKFLQPIINEKQNIVDGSKINPSSITVQQVYDLAAKEEKVAGSEFKDIAKKYAGITAAIGKSFTARVESAGMDSDAQKAAQAEFVSVKTAISVGYTVLTQSARNIARMVTFSKEIRESCAKIIVALQAYYAKNAKAESECDEFEEDEYLTEIDPEFEDEGMFSY